MGGGKHSNGKETRKRSRTRKDSRTEAAPTSKAKGREATSSSKGKSREAASSSKGKGKEVVSSQGKEQEFFDCDEGDPSQWQPDFSAAADDQPTESIYTEDTEDLDLNDSYENLNLSGPYGSGGSAFTSYAGTGNKSGSYNNDRSQNNGSQNDNSYRFPNSSSRHKSLNRGYAENRARGSGPNAFTVQQAYQPMSPGSSPLATRPDVDPRAYGYCGSNNPGPGQNNAPQSYIGHMDTVQTNFSSGQHLMDGGNSESRARGSDSNAFNLQQVNQPVFAGGSLLPGQLNSPGSGGLSTAISDPALAGAPSKTKKRRVNVLSLDGGGVRGLSSLYVLYDLMERLNRRRDKEGKEWVRPWQVFDLIGGTSTGGIIAIMLGRLRMDIEDCIQIYKDLFKPIFSKPGWKIGLKGDIKYRYDYRILEDAIKNVIGDEINDREALLYNNSKDCRVAVCAVQVYTREPILLRSYSVQGPQASQLENMLRPKIWQAARATSAAPGFFERMVINQQEFVDGGMGYNNPIDVLWSEAQGIFLEEGTGTHLEDEIDCLVSLGTGHPDYKSVQDKNLLKLLDTMVTIATDATNKAEDFARRHTHLIQAGKYFRFDVSYGVGNIELDEWKKMSIIVPATTNYMKVKTLSANTCAEALNWRD